MRIGSKKTNYTKNRSYGNIKAGINYFIISITYRLISSRKIIQFKISIGYFTIMGVFCLVYNFL